MVPKQTFVWVLGLLFRSLAEGGRAALGAMLMEMIFSNCWYEVGSELNLKELIQVYKLTHSLKAV